MPSRRYPYLNLQDRGDTVEILPNMSTTDALSQVLENQLERCRLKSIKTQKIGSKISGVVADHEAEFIDERANRVFCFFPVRKSNDINPASSFESASEDSKDSNDTDGAEEDNNPLLAVDITCTDSEFEPRNASKPSGLVDVPESRLQIWDKNPVRKSNDSNPAFSFESTSEDSNDKDEVEEEVQAADEEASNPSLAVNIICTDAEFQPRNASKARGLLDVPKSRLQIWDKNNMKKHRSFREPFERQLMPPSQFQKRSQSDIYRFVEDTEGFSDILPSDPRPVWVVASMNEMETKPSQRQDALWRFQLD